MEKGMEKHKISMKIKMLYSHFISKEAEAQVYKEISSGGVLADHLFRYTAICKAYISAMCSGAVMEMPESFILFMVSGL